MSDIIIDHCSMSWAVDENCSPYINTNFTMQWCMIYEGLYRSVHGKGDHSYGGIWGGIGASFHHNLMAHNHSRNPRFQGSRYHGEPEKEIVDFRNNVIFNWGINSSYGGEAGNQNIIANYYKAGPASKHKNRIVEPWDSLGIWYVHGNYVYGFNEISAYNWHGGVQGKNINPQRTDTPFRVPEIKTQCAEDAFDLVLKNAGAVLPNRDNIDRRIVEEVRSGIVNFGINDGVLTGIINSQEDVGGWPVLNSAEAPEDTDCDGMPDEWEEINGLNKFDEKDRNQIQEKSGYTALELYLNSLVTN